MPVPLGTYWRRSRLVFSLLPRCQGDCGSQKQTLIFVAMVNAICPAISDPRSHVSDRCSSLGRLRACLIRAVITLCLSLLSTLASITNRAWRSMNVAMLLLDPTINSPSHVWMPALMQEIISTVQTCDRVRSCVRPQFATFHMPRAGMAMRRSGPYQCHEREALWEGLVFLTSI